MTSEPTPLTDRGRDDGDQTQTVGQFIAIYFLFPLPLPLGFEDKQKFTFTEEPSPEEAALAVERDPSLSLDQAMEQLPARTASVLHHKIMAPADHASWLFTLAAEVMPWGYAVVDPPEPLPDLTQSASVLEVAVITGEQEPDQSTISDAFDYAVECAQRIQDAHYLHTRTPTPTLTRGLLPVIVPAGTASVGEGRLPGPGSAMLFLNERPLERLGAQPVVNDEFGSAWAVIQHGHPLSRFIDLEREAAWALRGSDNPWAALLGAATASEYLLNTLLQMLMWEDGLTPELAAPAFAPTRAVATRLDPDVNSRLGGDWSVRGRGPVGQWHREVAGVRNLALHLGREVTRDEALTALDRVSGLGTFIAGRLATAANVAKYPRTALAFVGQPGLERRGRWTRRVKNVAQSDLAFDRFMRWRHTLARRWEGARTPSLAAKMETLAVLGPDSSVYWVLVDRSTYLAAPARLLPGALTEVQRQALRAIRAAHMEVRDAQAPHFVSILMHGANLAEPVGEWRDQNWLLPMSEILVAGDDLEQGYRGLIPDSAFSESGRDQSGAEDDRDVPPQTRSAGSGTDTRG